MGYTERLTGDIWQLSPVAGASLNSARIQIQIELSGMELPEKGRGGRRDDGFGSDCNSPVLNREPNSKLLFKETTNGTRTER